MDYYLVFDKHSNAIGRYKRDSEPPKPALYNGEWNVGKVSKDKALSKSIDWFDK